MTGNRIFQILLVDDDPDMLRLLENIIRRDFSSIVRIQALNDPQDARRCLESELIDILITDLEMPDIDGLKLLHYAKRKNVWTQVLVVTGHSNFDALMDAMEYGATDYLLKPIDLQEFDEAIACMISRSCRWRKALAGTIAAG
jgi:DNA-binding NtrC family response regulator